MFHGLIALSSNALPSAAAYFTQAQATAEANGDQFSRVHALHNLGHVALWRGEYRQAEAYFEESLRMAYTAERGSIPWILLSLARVAKVQGALPRARALAREGLAGVRDRAAVAGVLEGLEILAGVLVAEKRLEDAVKLFGAASALRERHGLVQSMNAPDRVEHEQNIALVRSQLDTVAFAMHNPLA